MPDGKTEQPAAAPPWGTAFAQAVRAARALFALATTTRRFGQTARTFVAHCSATQSDAWAARG